MQPYRKPLDIAVIGSGIAGLSAAWLLQSRHRVTLYERDSRLGGHSNTVDALDGGGRAVPVDTGFIVYNDRTYPNLVAMLRHLGVESHASDMSFAVSVDDGGFEYSGTDLKGLFAQPANLLRPRFWRMLRDLRRFYGQAPDFLAHPATDCVSLGAYLDQHGYSNAFLYDHLLPMGAAIWSTAVEDMRDHPAASFIRFFHSHGLLQILDRPKWRTVTGGARAYVDRLAAPLAGRIRLDAAPVAVRRDPGGVTVVERSGDSARFDQIVIATHADQALALLADPDADERQLLGAFRYARNHAILHTDPGMMPKRRRAWSSWNYARRRGTDGREGVCVTYWMNKLQDLPPERDLFVTLNPVRPPRDGTILRSFDYDHPSYDTAALAAQRSLWSLQGNRRTWFCGSYFGSGFHEDALQSGLAVAEAVGSVRRPWSVPEESGRIMLAPPFIPADAAE
jgi:predicted NAD/FAD-binding protein